MQKSSKYNTSQPYDAILPNIGQEEGPILNAEAISLGEAQARVSSHSIPLPEGFEIKQVWITKGVVDPTGQYVAVEFDADLLLITRRSEKPPDWDGIIANVPELTKIMVNGNPGMGTSPGFTIYRGKDFPYPGSVEWWMDGLNITLYSDTFSLEELLTIAETVH